MPRIFVFRSSFLVRSFLTLLVAGLVALVTGCGPPEAETVANHGEIRDVMNLLGKTRGDEEAIAKLFVEGAAPDKAWFEQISKRLVEIDEIKIDEGTATVRFSAEQHTAAPAGSAKRTFVRSEEGWKISEAPLPTNEVSPSE